MNIFLDDVKKPYLKSTQKDIKNIINNHTFIVQEQDKGESVNICMDAYTDKIQSDGSLDNLKLIIVVSGYLQNKELVGDTWPPTASMRNSKYFFG